MPRLFFALLPDALVRAEIQAFADTLSLDGGRLVPELNTHITLAFLGMVEEVTCDELITGASLLRAAPFSLRLDSMTWWPKPKILCLAPSSYPDTLTRLATDLHELSKECGVVLDGRPCNPHLTLARKIAVPHPDIHLEPISWNINEFCLVESKPRENGVEYQVKVSWPLKIM